MNPIVRSVTSTGSIPEGNAGTGTCSTDSATPTTITGVGTNFTEVYLGIIPNEWIYFPELNEIRRVIGVSSDTTLIIDRAITITTEDWVYITCKIVAFSVVNVGGVDGEYDGVSFVAGEDLKEGPPPSCSFCNAHTFDATGSTFKISESY